MKIFPARAYIDYNTEYEIEYISSIKENWDNEAEIIKFPFIPKNSARFGAGLFQKEMELFFPLIDECDILIAAPVSRETNADGSKRNDKGKLSEGVKDEILYALGIGKKVYIYSENSEFKEIKSISDSDELIYQLVLLDKHYHVLDRNGREKKIKALLGNEKRLNIHSKMVDFYFRNKVVRDLIKDFLYCGDECVKPITVQYRFPYLVELRNPVRYVPLNYRRKTLEVGSKNRLMTINDMSKESLIKREGELHFYECIFDSAVGNGEKIDYEISEVMRDIVAKGGTENDFKPGMVFDNHIIGINVVFDIDGPSGVDLFDKKWWSDFITMKEAGVSYFKDDLKMKCLCSTTGNGFNITSEPHYFGDGDNDNFYDFKDGIEDDIDVLNDLYRTVISGRVVTGTGESRGFGRVRIDNAPVIWSIYKKMVFTYHAKYNRITLPVNKEIGIDDREWLMKVSDIDYFLSDETKNINEIINRSDWLKDKWW